MLQWLPERRKTGRELLQHSFLESVRQDRVNVESIAHTHRGPNKDAAIIRRVGGNYNFLNL
ncbi:hypothetical protein BX600DRAFT_460499 [Xylariales sp. PMI_506]|nr:hypothetical protein BX600DRAFT_460499 [Xylariales sp. PMI_506]